MVRADELKRWQGFVERCDNKRLQDRPGKPLGSKSWIAHPYLIWRVDGAGGRFGPIVNKARTFEKAVVAGWITAEGNRSHFHNYTRPPEVDKFQSIAITEKGELIIAFKMRKRDAELMGWTTYVLPELHDRFWIVVDRGLAQRRNAGDV